MSNKQCNVEQMGQNKNSKVTPISLDEQPLSFYKWIAFRKGYNTLREVADHFNINYEQLVEAVNTKKRKSEKVITGVVKSFLKYDLTYKGKFITIEEIVKMTGLSKSLVTKRLTRKWSVKRIINTPVRQKDKTEIYSIQGKKYYGLGEVSKVFNISRQTLQYRVKHSGMTIEEAVFALVKSRYDFSFYCLGKKWKNLTALCAEYDLSEATLKENLIKDPEKSLDDVVLRMLGKRPYYYIVDDKEYPTIKSIADAYGVDVKKMYSRMHAKKKYSTIEEIIETLKKEKGE